MLSVYKDSSLLFYKKVLEKELYQEGSTVMIVPN